MCDGNGYKLIVGGTYWHALRYLAALWVDGVEGDIPRCNYCQVSGRIRLGDICLHALSLQEPMESWQVPVGRIVGIEVLTEIPAQVRAELERRWPGQVEVTPYYVEEDI